MGFPEFPFPNKGKSFVSNEEVLEFIDSYAREFKLNDVVKLAHNVVNVIPIADSRWQVCKYLPNKTKQNHFIIEFLLFFVL